MGILKHRRVFFKRDRVWIKTRSRFKKMPWVHFNFTFRMQHRHFNTLTFNEYAVSEEVPKVFIYSSSLFMFLYLDVILS